MRLGAAPAGLGPTARSKCGQGRFVQAGCSCLPEGRGVEVVGSTPMIAARVCEDCQAGLNVIDTPWQHCKGVAQKGGGCV